MLRLIGQTVNKPKEEEAEKEQPERLSSHFLISQNWVNKTALQALSDFANI